jgi:hypothetical protein
MTELRISELSESQVDSELASLIAAAGPDERRVLLFICSRFIGIGQRDFGQLDLRAELRDGFQEAAEEAADGLFYMSLRFLLAQINRPLIPEAHDTEPGRMHLEHRVSQPIGPARYRNEAGQLVEDDDVPDEDWPR